MNPLNQFHPIKDLSNFETKKQSPPTNSTTEVSQKVFKQINKKDHPKDSEFLTQIATKMAENRRPMPSSSPFSDTDLIVFKDNYSGTLPRKGIRESELTLISEIYNQVSNDQSKIYIESDDVNFKKEMLLSIKTLLTREIGRKLIKKLLHLSAKTIITPGPICKAFRNRIEINLNDNIHLIAQHPSSGKRMRIPDVPLFLSLGHEMIHITHSEALEDAMISPNLEWEYDNLEEQITITGLKKGLRISISDESENWEPIIPEGYDELNERNLTEAFTGSLTEFYSEEEKIRFPRFGHHAISENLSLTQLLKKLVEENVLLDLEHLIQKHSINRDSLNTLFKPGELHALAIANGRSDILKLLLKIDPNPTLQEGSLLLIALKNALILKELSQLQPILQTLFETGIDIKLPDKTGSIYIIDVQALGVSVKGNTPLHYCMYLAA